MIVPADTLTRYPASVAFPTTAVQELSQPKTVTVTNGPVPMTPRTLRVVRRGSG